MNQEKIGKFIAKLRKEKNMTQEELADKLRVSNKSVSRWENGRCMPDLSLFEPLSSELGVSINDLMNGEIVDKQKYQGSFENNVVKTIAKINISNKKIIMTIISISVILLLIFGFSVKRVIDNNLNNNLISPNSNIRNVTSQQVKSINKGMTYKEIITKLGSTIQDGYGAICATYLVDNKDLLSICFGNINDICDKSGEEIYDQMINFALIDIAYNYLDNETKSKIINLYESDITTLKIENNAYLYLNKDSEMVKLKNKEIILVDFKTDLKVLPSNRIVILDADTKEVLGLGLVD